MQYPHISLHELSENLTPVQRQTPGSGKHAHIAQQVWVAPKIKLHEPVQVTPVTSVSRSRLDRIRVNSVPPDEASSVRRRLFPVPTPSKKRKALNDLQLSFRVNCGRERTQPLANDKKRREGPLASNLTKSLAEAAANIQVLKDFVANKGAGRRELNSVLEKGLVFEVLGYRSGSISARRYVAVHYGENQTESDDAEVAVLVPALTASEANESNEGTNNIGSLIFVPQPWYVYRSDQSVSNSGLFIVPFKFELIRKQEIANLIDSVRLNMLLESWLCTGSLCGSQFEIPATQEEGQEILEHSGSSSKCELFANISTHCISVTLFVFVDIVCHESKVAVLRDSDGEYALLTWKSVIPQAASNKQNLENLVVASLTFPLTSLLELVARTPDDNCAKKMFFQGMKRVNHSASLLVFSNSGR